MKWENTFRVGVYTCHITFSKNCGVKASWSPCMPEAKSFSQQQMAEYRAGRDNLLAEVAKEMGGNVLVIE